MKAIVFAPADTSATRLALLESLSATIRLVDGDVDARLHLRGRPRDEYAAAYDLYRDDREDEPAPL